MRSTCIRWLLTATLVGGTIGSVAAQPNVRDHRKPKDTYVDAGPREAPPPVRVERIGRRKGFVWVAGNWDWKNGKWEWVSGRWERQRIGRKFSGTRWEKRGDVFVRVDGDWIDAGAPPPPREEKIDVRPGFVFVKGHWDWDNGEWTWVAGRWDKEQRGKRWREDRWERKGDEWVLVAGGWDIDNTPVAQYPNAAPPTPRQEKFAARAGFVWDPGHWEWKNGQWAWLDGHWERERAGGVWRPGRWENRGGRWEWLAGGWDDAPIAAYPTAPPPPPPADAIPRPGIGQVWIPGRYLWNRGRYEWKSGVLDKARPGFRFQAGTWTKQGDRFVWADGQWVTDGPTSAPPALKDERPGTRNGWTFIPGRWKWDNGQWAWDAGRWEKERDDEAWVAGRWENRGGRWEWSDGRWDRLPQFPTAPPPPPVNERVETRPGYAWAFGFYRWAKGRYEWQPGRLVPGHAGERHIPHEWVKRGDRFEMQNDRWERVATPPPPPPTDPYGSRPPPPSGNGPRQAPPAPKEEKYDRRVGFLWARGHWEWKNSNYEWLPGHWERERAQKKWVDARWEQRGDTWFFIDGHWE